jgi:acyl-CoA synthetase (AMP-forming)/AMP-acid ligase II
MESPPSSLDPLLSLIHLQARVRASDVYLLDARSKRTLSYAALGERVDEHRHALRSWGLKSGERVGLVVGDTLTFAEWFLAGISFGAWVAPLDPTPASALASATRAATLGVSLIVSEARAPEGSAQEWMSADSFDPEHAEAVTEEIEPSRGGIILSSSGTTGTPKVMALSVDQLLATAELIVEHHRFLPSDRGFNPLPLWHVNAEVVGLLSTLCVGASLVLDERFHRTDFWTLVNGFDVSWINAVPAIIARLANLNEGEAPSRAIRFVRSASAPLTPSLFERFEAHVGVPVIQSYGMTEAASQICVSPIDDVRKAGSVGRPAGVEVRVLAQPGEVGPIEITGPTVITRYQSPGYDERFSEDGWLRTGDLGFFDADGYLFIVGRNDDVINRGGEKIYPLEIEEILTTVEGVARVAVVGREDEVFGHVPVAFIQPTGDVAMNESELAELVERVRAHASARLPSTRRPMSVSILAELPAHATGKIQNAHLRRGDVDVVYEERL